VRTNGEIWPYRADTESKAAPNSSAAAPGCKKPDLNFVVCMKTHYRLPLYHTIDKRYLGETTFIYTYYVLAKKLRENVGRYALDLRKSN